MADDLGYKGIADDLRTRINAGEFAPGDRLGTEKQLAWEYGQGVWTIGNAVDLLRREGYVEPFRRGKGAIVAKRGPTQEVAYRVGTLISARLATMADAEKAADDAILPGVVLLVATVDGVEHLHRADVTVIRFY